MATSDVNNTIMVSVSRTAPRMQMKFLGATDPAYPGCVLMIVWDANNNKMLELQSVSTEVPAQPIICVENTRAGKTIDDSYTAGETIYAVQGRPGDVMLVRANFIAATSVQVGTVLSCYGAIPYEGHVRVPPAAVTDPSSLICKCVEYKSVSATGETALVKVEVC